MSTSRLPTGPLKAEIRRYLKKWGLDTDVAYYSKTAWRARGEPYGNNAAFSMTFEGPLYEALNYGEWGGWKARGAQDFLIETGRKHGFYYEQGYAWSMHWYPL